MADANIIVKIIDQTSGGISSIERQLNATERSVQKTNTAFGGLTRAVGALAAAFGAREIIQFADNIQTLQNRLRLVTDSQEELNKTFDNLTQIANRSRADLGGIIDLYSKIQLSTKDLGISTEEAARVTESFGKLLAIAGAETAASEGAIRQFSQALASGAFRGDEFNSVVEAAPGILDILAKKLGVSRGEIRGLAADGELTAQVLIEALTESADTIDQQFGQTTVTIGQALTVLKNNFIDLGRNATPAADALAQAILFVAENLETAIIFAGSFIAAFAAAKLAAIVTSVGGITAAVRALNIAISSNPIGLIATAIATAATLIITNFDDIKFAGKVVWNVIKLSYEAFESTLLGGWQKLKVAGMGLWTGIQEGYLNFETAILKGTEKLINTVINGFSNFASEIIAKFKAVGAAVADPLNAFEAYNRALEESRAEIEQTQGKVVDFSGAIGENEARIQELNQALEEEKAKLETTGEEINRNADTMGVYDDAILRTTRSTEGITQESDKLAETQSILERAIQLARGETEDLDIAQKDLNITTGESNSLTQDNTTARSDNTEQVNRQTTALQEAEAVINENIAAIQTEIKQIGLSEIQREKLSEIIEAENRIRKALGDTVEELTQEEIQLLTELVKENEAATADFLRLSDDKIQAIVDVVDERERALREFEDNQKEEQRLAEETNREMERLAQEREDFIRDVNNAIRDYEFETMTEVERLTAEKEEFIRQAEEQGLADHQSIMDRIVQYDQMIRDEQTRILEQQQREQARIEEAAARERERELQKELREQERQREAHLREVERFTENSSREMTRIRRSEMTESMRLEDERQEYLAEARRLGLEDHKEVQDRLLGYEQQIAQARIDEQERAAEELQRVFDDQVSKYSTLYNKMEDRLVKFLGISKSKFEEYNEIAELFLGVNIRDIIKNTFAKGTIFIENFRNSGKGILGGFNTFIKGLFGMSGSGVGGIIKAAFNNNLVSGFINFSRNAFNGLRNIISNTFSANIFNTFLNAGRRVFNSLTNIAGQLFRGLSSGLGGFISSFTRSISTGSIGRVVGSVVSGGKNLLSSIWKGIKGIFGFDLGGYIPGGSMGIVGEFGPELVSGPATVTGRQDTAELLGGPVNVNFTINAVDARGVDRLLVERKTLIKNIVQDAVAQRGRSI